MASQLLKKLDLITSVSEALTTSWITTQKRSLEQYPLPRGKEWSSSCSMIICVLLQHPMQWQELLSILFYVPAKHQGVTVWLAILFCCLKSSHLQNKEISLIHFVLSAAFLPKLHHLIKILCQMLYMQAAWTVYV